MYYTERMYWNNSLVCAVFAALLLVACEGERLECHSVPVNWQEVIETIGPLPEYGDALSTVGESLSLAGFKVIWDRYGEQGNELLESIGRKDNKLAETLFLFGARLRAGDDPDEVLKDAFTHYVINTGNHVGFGELAAPSPRRLAQSYAQTLCIPVDDELLPGTEENSLFALREAGVKMNGIRYGRRDVLPTSLFRFEHGQPDYRKINAMWMAEMSALAYHDRKIVEEQLRQWDYLQDFEWIEGEKSETQGFVAANDRHVILVFRGTSSIKDLQVDLTTVRQPEQDSGGVHSGFQSALDDVWQETVEPAVMRMIRSKDLYVTGHSLGAALAQLAAYRLTVRSKIPVTAIYTFGSPLVGDVNFTADYDAQLASRTHSHINYEDLVTRIPPRWLGFRRLGMNSTWKFTGRKHALALFRDLAGNGGRIGQEDELEIAADGSVQLDPSDESAIQRDYANADRQLKRSTAYLDRKGEEHTGEPGPPRLTSYDTIFQGGHLDDHGIYEYLFKLACANVEEYADNNGVNAQDLGRRTTP